MKKLIGLGIIVSWIFLLSAPACRKDPPAVQPPENPPKNKAPVAKAVAASQTILSACKSMDGVAELDGTGSFDPDGQIMSHNWRILFGPHHPMLINASSPRGRLENLAVGTYALELTVIDDKGLAARDTLFIEVEGKPTKYKLDLSFQAPYSIRDSLADCYYYSFYCNNFLTTIVEGIAQLPGLGTLNIHILENAIVSSYLDYKKAIVHLYIGDPNDKLMSGITDLRFHEIIESGSQNFNGEINIIEGSAQQCDLQFYVKNQLRLSISGSVNQLMKTITLRISGKAFF